MIRLLIRELRSMTAVAHCPWAKNALELEYRILILFSRRGSFIKEELLAQ